MTQHRLLSLLSLVALLSLAAYGCGDEKTSEAPNPNTEIGDGTCAKCDGPFGRFKDAYNDMKEVDLTDLTILGAGLATDELNGQLSATPYSDIAISRTQLYGQPDEIFGETLVHDITALRAGLTEGLGEHAFATRINALRDQTTQAKPGSVFAESHFTLGANLKPSWNIDAGDAVGAVGFQAGKDIEAVLIAPYKDAKDAVWQNPLQTVKDIRGFIIPRDLNDVRDMQPGESLALRSEGALGLNLGVGVPFMLATVADSLVLRSRLSFAARVGLKGILDVQLIRGEGNVAYVDVGVSEQTLRHFEVALTTGWGVEGLPEVDLDLGVVDLDIDKIAEKALSKELNKHLNARAAASSTTRNERLSVARFRFDTSKDGTELEQALAQALKGDIRLAQALANRDNAGVVQELDLLRDAHSEANYLGFAFLGMEFYRAQSYRTGVVQIEADGSNQTLLFSEIDRKSGLFFNDKKTSWRKVVSLKSEDGALVDAQVNARLTIHESDSFFNQDQYLDHIDPLLTFQFGYQNFYNGPGRATDDLLAYVDNACPKPSFDNEDDHETDAYHECVENLPSKPETVALRQKAEAAYEEALEKFLVRGFDAEVMSDEQVADTFFASRLEWSARVENSAEFTLPKGNVLTQVRFSHDALEDIFRPDNRFEFRKRLAETLSVMAVDRDEEDFEEKTDDVEDYVEDRENRLDEMADVFKEASLRYFQLNAVADASIDRQHFGDQIALVTVEPTNNGRDAKINLASVAEHKGNVVENLLPELADLAEKGIWEDLDEPAEFVVGYTFLNMTRPEQIELLSRVKFEEDGFGDLELYTRGTSTFIDAGQFNLDELLAP